MDPTQAAQSFIEGLLHNQWFVAATIFIFFLFFIAGVVWLNKRMDDRDAKWFERLDKRDEEIKEMVHNYYNATGTTSLTLQAVGQSMGGVADELQELRHIIDTRLGAKS